MVQSKQMLEMVIPPGVNDGATIQIRGEGNSDKNRLAVSYSIEAFFVDDNISSCR